MPSASAIAAQFQPLRAQYTVRQCGDQSFTPLYRRQRRDSRRGLVYQGSSSEAACQCQSVGHGVTGSRQSTRWLGPWVTPSVGPRGRRPRHQTLLGYGGPRRRILMATAALKSLRLFARVHHDGGGLRAERIPTNLCEEVFSDTHFAAGAVSPLGILICWPDTMPDHRTLGD